MKAPTLKLLRFADLREARIVSSWPQLKRLVDGSGFPPGYLLSAHTRVWDADAVEAWVEARRQAAAARANQVAA